MAGATKNQVKSFLFGYSCRTLEITSLGMLLANWKPLSNRDKEAISIHKVGFEPRT